MMCDALAINLKISRKSKYDEPNYYEAEKTPNGFILMRIKSPTATKCEKDNIYPRNDLVGS